ncbi:MAG: hypothetical protein HFH87_06260 [Lachnospiraceae bacterium]|nr:hypothetical protein [Lachnospiraceae bacterium]
MMKLDDRKGMESVGNKFLQLPNIQRYEIDRKTKDGFIASVEMDDGFEFKIYAFLMQQIYPSTVMKLIEKKSSDKGVCILVSPYISDRTAQICKENGMGYFDYAGNCWFVGHSIYLHEKGNKNPQPKQCDAVSIFERSSVVSTLILREFFIDVNRVWKLKHLSEKIGCSIGQVSKVMTFLIRNAWAVKKAEGYAILEPGSVLREWSKIYGKKEVLSYPCYSLDNLSVLEGKLRKLKQDMGIESYLTGLSGGVRYTPVVRYNKIHVYIAPEDIREAIDYLELKEVDSGANVIIFPLENDSYIKDWRIIEGDMVVSPLQIYLDSMQLKGRGEEMAEAVLNKEIIK